MCSAITGRAWDSYSEKVKAGIELQIEPYGGDGDGLSFNSPDEITSKMKFDGNDYPDLDPNNPGTAFSGHRVNQRSLEITHKSKTKMTSTRQLELSPDLNTLTMTLHLVGQNRPKSILGV